MRKIFNEQKWDVVVVNERPYMCCDMRIDRDSVPEGLIMYEVADADSDGEFCRISSGIMVNFLCTIVGREELPMEEGAYYCKYDEEFEKRREEFMENLNNQLDEGLITEKEFDDKVEEYHENNFPENEDGWFVAHEVDVLEYLENYNEYLEQIASVE